MREGIEEAGAINVVIPIVRFSHATGCLEEMNILQVAATGTDVA